MYRTAPLATPEMPPGIPHIIGNEFAERFSFYGMRAILMVFMTTALVGHDGAKDLMGEEQAAKWFHTFVTAVYFTPLLGALIADLWLGKYRTIIGLSLVYCLGHLALAVDSTRTGLFVGLTLIAIGSGGIKPCVSAHVGDQFGQTNARLLPRIYNWFYLAINTGSFFSMLITPWLLAHRGPHVAFALPGVLMFIATVVFWMGRREFAHIPPEPDKFARELKQPEFLRSLAGLAVIYVFVAMFWSLFDQTSSRWVAQSEKMDLHVFGIELLPSQLQSVNPLLVITLIPLFSLVVYPALGRVVEVTPLRKLSAGFFLAVPSFVIPAWIESQIAAGATPSVWWQILAYLFMTTAEILISITCLEFSYTQAPPRLKSFIMGLYLWSVSLGNSFTALVNWWVEHHKDGAALDGAAYYWFFVKCISVTAVLFVFVAMFYKGRTHLQQETPAPPDTPPVGGG
ncbi:MAG: POT family MFS transporter [Verrucomicrobiaceae bacterium]|nr:POT family MFS transporter [Verrucomicrobiaceae bacterium]